MHPNELKNRALVAASEAEVDGFFATAEALLNIAKVCERDASALNLAYLRSHRPKERAHA